MDSSSSDDEVLSSVKRSKSSKDRFLDAEESDSSIGSGSYGEGVGRNSDVGEESNEERGSPSSESDENEERNQSNFDKKKVKKHPGSASNNDQTLNQKKSPSSEASDEEDLKDEKKYIKTKGSRSNGKQKDGESAKLLRLKKYLTVAGIKIQNYSKLFEDCKSKKSKETKLLELLESKGLKGKPTLEKCKKLRKKIEREKEVAELDLGNIIDSNDGGGSSRSARSRMTRYQMNSVEGETKMNVKSHKKDRNIFGNLHGIIDSEGSENDESNEERLHKQKRLKLIESDEES